MVKLFQKSAEKYNNRASLPHWSTDEEEPFQLLVLLSLLQLTSWFCYLKSSKSLKGFKRFQTMN